MTKGSPNPPLSLALLEYLAERQPDGCLLWRGSRNSHGYARYSFGGQRLIVHRWAYEAAIGPIPADWTVDHQCHDPEVCLLNGDCPHRRCIEPAHLKAMTNAENSMRGGSPLARKKRQTHCKLGHELSGDNLYVSPKNGQRQCRACRAEVAASSYKKKRAQPDSLLVPARDFRQAERE